MTVESDDSCEMCRAMAENLAQIAKELKESNELRKLLIERLTR